MTIIGGCTVSSESSDPPAEEMYQISTLSALAAGGYDGLIDMDELLDQGDFGLGTFDHLDGEMIVYDGVVYRVPANGVPEEVDGDVTTPFAAVTPWDPEREHEFSDPLSCSDLEAAIDGLLDSVDEPYALKVEGRFTSLTTRSEERQEPPYIPLADVLENQIVFDLGEVDAILVGFRLPDYMANSNAAGFHFHALADDNASGGHVLDCQTAGEISVEIDEIDSWQVDLHSDD